MKRLPPWVWLVVAIILLSILQMLIQLLGALLKTIMNGGANDDVSFMLTQTALDFAVQFVPLLAFIPLIIITYMYTPIRLTSTGKLGSMAPTLYNGDLVLFDKWSVRQEKPFQRGEIILFSPPEFAQKKSYQNYVKRIIGMPGDKIEMKALVGILVNDKLLVEPYAFEPLESNATKLGDIGGIVNGERLRPYADPSMANEPIVVPPKHLFVVGDNRNRSEDSRSWGFLPQQRVHGRMYKMLRRNNRLRGMQDDPVLSCKFCGLNQTHVAFLLTGTVSNICSDCVASLAAELDTLPRELMTCSFCRVHKNCIAGKIATICSECILDCKSQLAGDEKEDIAATGDCAFCAKQTDGSKLLRALQGKYMCFDCAGGLAAALPAAEKIQSADPDDSDFNEAPEDISDSPCLFCNSLKVKSKVTKNNATVCGICVRICDDFVNYDARFEKYSRLIADDPTDAESYAKRSSLVLIKNDFQSARKDIDKAIELNPKSTDYLRSRAFLHDTVNEHALALADYTTALSLKPTNINLLAARANCYIELEQFEKALEDLESELALLTDDSARIALNSNNRGRCLLSLGRFEEALPLTEKAVALYDKHARLYFNRGWAHQELGNHEQAVADFTKAIKLDPGLAKAYQRRGDSYETLGRHELALADKQTFQQITR